MGFVMRNIGIALVMFCLGAVGCNGGVVGGDLGQNQQPQQLVACGGKAGLQCDAGFTCVDDPSDFCDMEKDGPDCGGICVEETKPSPAFCGGIAGTQCEAGFTCVDDPSDFCDMEKDGPDCGGICVEEAQPPPQFCGGFADIQCPSGLTCIDDPSDDCDAGDQGGADCSGICVTP
jgi:hypothetical protein